LASGILLWLWGGLVPIWFAKPFYGSKYMYFFEKQQILSVFLPNLYSVLRSVDAYGLCRIYFGRFSGSQPPLAIVLPKA